MSARVPPLAVSAADYHADLVADVPTLSRSVAYTLLTRSPLHAWFEHPKLNPNFRRVEKQDFDLGNAAHELYLGGPDRVQVLEFDSWRTNEAKELRELARQDGKLPLLAKNAGDVAEAVAAARALVGRIQSDPAVLDASLGKPEQTVVWEDEGVALRARLDWLHDDLRAVDDLKFTGRVQSASAWKRTVFSMGYDFQAAFYERAIAKTTGRVPVFRLVIVETSPPYGVHVLGFSSAAMDIARRKVQAAIDLWRECLEADEWPGYPPRVEYADLPPWEEAAWLERELEAAA